MILSPIGFAGIIGIIFLLILNASVKNAKWAVMAILLWISTMGFMPDPWIDHTLAPPLQQIRSVGRPLTLALLLSLITASFSMPARCPGRPALATVLLFVFQMALPVRQVLAGSHLRGISSGLIFVCLFIILGISIRKWIQDVADIHKFLWSVAAAGALFILSSIYQVAVNPDAAVWANRFFGITSNPQHAAQYLAMMILPTTYLLICKRYPLIVRYSLGALLGLMFLFLIWTGSRTGFLMTVVGLILLFGRQLGKLTFVILAVGIVATIASLAFTESLSGLGRLFSTMDTRGEGLIMTFQAFLASPIIGDAATFPDGRPVVVENSYLAVARLTGIVGLLFLTAWIVSIICLLRRITHVKRTNPDQILLVNLIIAAYVSLLAGALFEGYLLVVLSMPVYLLYVYISAASVINDVPSYSFQRSDPIHH